MSDSPILGQVALGYSPMIDRERAVMATRLTVFPLRPDAQLDVSFLLQAVGDVWPAGGGRVSLNVLSESLLQDLLRAAPTPNLMVEIPSFMAVDPMLTDAIRTLHANGNTLLLKGRPLSELPREVLPAFTYSIIDVEEDRRLANSAAPEGVTRRIGHVQSNVRTAADLEASFARGAQAVLGWPIEDVSANSRKSQQHDLQVLVELIRQVDAEQSIDKLENTLKRDPTIAFKLLRYINSPAFGLRVEITSFGHAIMMLGYKKLKRWLALLLATAGKDVNLRPVMFAAVRRGLLMEELARGVGDEEMRGELFICGVFSLLDKMMGEPFDKLLKSVPVPEGVVKALAEETGPYWPYVQIIRAIESESLYDIREAMETLMMGAAETNRSILRALSGAGQLE